MPFPIGDPYWAEALAFLQRHVPPLAPLLAPNDFLEYLPGTYHYHVAQDLPPEHFDFVVLHRDCLGDVPRAWLQDVANRYTAVFANGVFVVYAKRPLESAPPIFRTHLRPVLRHIAAIGAQTAAGGKAPGFACVITTYNRPRSLARTLPQVAALGAPMLVVDDASDDEHAQENRRLADAHRAAYLPVPSNRGLCNAVNAGVCYWLADRGIDWVSCFQDDVDVHPELFAVLAAVQDARERPLLTGQHAREHPVLASGAIAGYAVLYKRSTPGQHLHAHRAYWSSVLPVPTPYLGAPKPAGGQPGQGSDEDWWVTAWSPASITKRGGYVIVLPDLVRTFQGRREGSTWGNASVRGAAGEPAPGAPMELAVHRTEETAAWVPVSTAATRFDPSRND
jgi:hypothetical protein